MRFVFVIALFDYFRAPGCATVTVEDRLRLSEFMYDNLQVHEHFVKRIEFVKSNRVIEFAIYKNAKTRASIDGSSMICFVISLFVDLTIDAFRPHLAKHVDRALARLRREKRSAAAHRARDLALRRRGHRVDEVEAHHERREQLDERRRRAELEEEAARQAKLKAGAGPCGGAQAHAQGAGTGARTAVRRACRRRPWRRS